MSDVEVLAELNAMSKWLHDKHWVADEVTISAAGSAGQQNLGSKVSVGKTLRIREITVRHAGSNDTVVTLLVDTTTKLSFHVGAGTTRVWSSQDGRKFNAGEQPLVQSSDVTGGNTFVSAAGVEA